MNEPGYGATSRRGRPAVPGVCRDCARAADAPVLRETIRRRCGASTCGRPRGTSARGPLAQHEVPSAPLIAECVEGLRDFGPVRAGVRRARSSPSRQAVVPASGRAGSPAPEGDERGAGGRAGRCSRGRSATSRPGWTTSGQGTTGRRSGGFRRSIPATERHRGGSAKLERVCIRPQQPATLGRSGWTRLG